MATVFLKFGEHRASVHRASVRRAGGLVSGLVSGLGRVGFQSRLKASTIIVDHRRQPRRPSEERLEVMSLLLKSPKR